jgi:hypothetical protein
MIKDATTVSDASKMQVRVSPRLQGSKEEHILTKAKGRVARKNLEFKEVTPCPSSLLSVPRNLALDGLHQLGINLGTSSLEKDNNFYNSLGFGSGGYDCEVESFNQDWVDTDSEEESLEKLELKALRGLCGDLVEEVFDE